MNSNDNIREQIHQLIKSEPNEENTPRARFIFNNIDDMLIVETILEIHGKDLLQLQASIEEFKTNCNAFKTNAIEFTRENDFGRSFKEKTKDSLYQIFLKLLCINFFLSNFRCIFYWYLNVLSN